MKIVSSFTVVVESGDVYHFDVKHPFADSRLTASLYSVPCNQGDFDYWSFCKREIQYRLPQLTSSPLAHVRLDRTLIDWEG